MLAEELTDAAGAAGIICEKRACSFGATDAVAFARAGYRAASLTASDAMADYIHTPRDNAEGVNAEAIEGALRVLVEYLDRADND